MPYLPKPSILVQYALVTNADLPRLDVFGKAGVAVHMYFLYILKSIKYKKTYVGMTNNVQRRLSEHNKGECHFTKKYAPWVIIYTEILTNQEEAHKRERYFKSSVGRRWMKAKFNNADVAELVYAYA